MKYIIIGGCPRSGTTLTVYMLAQHPSLGLTIDLNLKRFSDAVDILFYRERALKHLAERKKSSKESWTLKDAIDLNFSTTMKRDLIEFMYIHQFEKQKDKLQYIGDKDPRYYYYFDLIQKEYVPLYTIHITRNPFDVINSMMRRAINYKQGLDTNWNQRFLELEPMCAEWNYAFNFARRQEEKNPLFIQIQYEDLVFDTENTLQRLLTQLDLDPEFDYSKYIPVRDFDHHFTRESLSAKDIQQIHYWIDVAGYAQYLRDHGVGETALAHLSVSPTNPDTQRDLDLLQPRPEEPPIWEWEWVATAKLKSLNQQLHTLRKLRDRFQQRLEEANQHRERQRAALTTTKEKRQQLQSNITSLQSQYKKTKEDLTNLRQKSHKLQQELARFQQMTHKLQQELADFQNQRQLLKTRLTEWHQKNKQLQQELTALKHDPLLKPLINIRIGIALGLKRILPSNTYASLRELFRMLR